MANDSKPTQHILSLRFIEPSAQFAGQIVGGDTLVASEGWRFEVSGGSVFITGGRVLQGQKWEAPRSACLMVWGE